jgi:hypothetical protein
VLLDEVLHIYLHHDIYWHGNPDLPDSIIQTQPNKNTLRINIAVQAGKALLLGTRLGLSQFL